MSIHVESSKLWFLLKDCLAIFSAKLKLVVSTLPVRLLIEISLFLIDNLNMSLASIKHTSPHSNEISKRSFFTFSGEWDVSS